MAESNPQLLVALGFGTTQEAAFAAHAQPGQLPGRVTAEHRGQLRVLTTSGELACTVTGRLRHDVDEGTGVLPCVGDWVCVTPQDDAHGVITVVLPRTTVLWRRMAGSDERTQVLLANVDTVCIVSALDGDINVRRVERFLALILEGGITPVVVLTKADLVPDTQAAVESIRAVAPAVPVHAVSAFTGEGLDALEHLLFARPTSIALVGSSGVGKSTLINRWMGSEVMVTSEVMEDGRGRHTTTHRQLMLRPAGGVLMDTPGVREVGMAWAEDGILGAFSDVDALAQGCRFVDCSHREEPGCAVTAAVEQGTLSPDRLEAFHRLQRENAYSRRREDPAGRRAQRAHERILGRALHAYLKTKRR